MSCARVDSLQQSEEYRALTQANSEQRLQWRIYERRRDAKPAAGAGRQGGDRSAAAAADQIEIRAGV